MWERLYSSDQIYEADISTAEENFLEIPDGCMLASY